MMSFRLNVISSFNKCKNENISMLIKIVRINNDYSFCLRDRSGKMNFERRVMTHALVFNIYYSLRKNLKYFVLVNLSKYLLYWGISAAGGVFYLIILYIIFPVTYCDHNVVVMGFIGRLLHLLSWPIIISHCYSTLYVLL